jgi:uncharacterized protein (TIGR02996 family)
VERVIAESTTADVLLEYICQHPSDDVARLAYADVLEETASQICAVHKRSTCPHYPGGEWISDGNMERAEFIRRSVASGLAFYPEEPGELPPFLPDWPEDVGWVGRGGFPVEVSLTTEAFAGGPCGRCDGVGVIEVDDAILPLSNEELVQAETCPACRGTGKTPGHAAALFKSAPIEKVTLSDKRPAQGVYPSESWYWEEGEADFWFLPRDLFDLLAGHRRASQRTDQHPSRQRHYDTGPAAHDALHAAALLLGRRRAWPCPRCKGRGKICIGVDNAGKSYDMKCPSCSGIGHTVEIR